MMLVTEPLRVVYTQSEPHHLVCLPFPGSFALLSIYYFPHPPVSLLLPRPRGRSPRLCSSPSPFPRPPGRTADCSGRCCCVKPWCWCLWKEGERPCRLPPLGSRFGEPAAHPGSCFVPESGQADDDASCVSLPPSGPVRHNSGQALNADFRQVLTLIRKTKHCIGLYRVLACTHFCTSCLFIDQFVLDSVQWFRAALTTMCL